MFFNIHKNFVAGNTILGFVGIYSVITQVYNPLNKQRIISRQDMLEEKYSIFLMKE